MMAASPNLARVVLQKVASASLQVNPDTDDWVDINDGVIVFVAFLKDATDVVLPKLIKALLGAKYFQGKLFSCQRWVRTRHNFCIQ